MSTKLTRVGKKSKPPLTSPKVSGEFIPVTDLGKRLMKIRKKYIAEGGKLFDWDGIEREVRDRRGGQRSTRR